MTNTKTTHNYGNVKSVVSQSRNTGTSYNHCVLWAREHSLKTHNTIVGLFGLSWRYPTGLSDKLYKGPRSREADNEHILADSTLSDACTQ